ncbi:DUF4262 domain-containing protein [Georgenia sp. TF02-10]|uniref:DUF4262 domain-containing protein n=1 Tax=Georgenia sp. TF02-10 TaxID=2917725 RepID=UPI001FA72DB1|nr:DUF4262 domain-containing protein [Georgenia sp. TF02-10]UNX55332.1 DUF4262 domain-containing protein [Georgenia sp. TF02-10]
MCLTCDGWSDEEIHQYHLDTIAKHGWVILGVEAGDGHPPFAYTIGLTRFHDHPELVISGFEGKDAAVMLNELAAHVREGHRFAAGDIIASFSPHRSMLVQVLEPRLMAYAQEMYGSGGARLVPGLQVVWTNHAGQWPWDPGWPTTQRKQELFGVPVEWST